MWRVGDDTSCITQSTLYTRLNLLKLSSLLKILELAEFLVLPFLQFENNRGPGIEGPLLKPCCTAWNYSFPETTSFRCSSAVIDEVNRPVMSLSVILPYSH